MVGLQVMTRDEIRSLVREEVLDMLGLSNGDVVTVWFGGSQTKKAIGEGVAKAGETHRFVLVDLTEVKRIAGRKPMWRP